MDHVPYPTNPALPLLEVNFVCGDIEKYDGLGFIDYPVRQGWSPYTGSSQWANCSSEVAAKRAQSWLYFGLLHEIFGAGYTQEKFLKPKPNGIGFLVDTRNLPDLLFKLSRLKYHEWPEIYNFNKSKDLEFVNRCRPICVEVNLQSDILDRYGVECRTISLSTKVLLQSVQTAICNLEQDQSQSIMATNAVFPTRLTYDRMVEAGWCPKQATDLSAYSVIGAHYLAALPRKHFGAGHENCNAKVCVSNNVDENSYVVAHTSEHCQCQMLAPELPEVIQAIKEGDIPLISISLTPEGDPQLTVLNASPDAQYTAISHVWIGGLGNFSQNQLPRCQLLRIHSLLKNLKSYKTKKKIVSNPLTRQEYWFSASHSRLFTALSAIIAFLIRLYRRKNSQSRNMELRSIGDKASVIFWMDTLCIPVGPEYASLRANAINRMDLIYAGARDVLVLDPELQQISLEGLPQEEISAHILCSPWMTRCWTLQEARLSSNWYAQFADGIFDPRSAQKRLMNDLGSFTASKEKFDDLGGLKHEMFVEWYYRQLHKHNLSELGLAIKVNNPFNLEWNNLAQRSTTKKEDIHCILANMLGFSAGELLELPYEERMKAILCTQTTLPLKLFFNPGPRIQDLDNRWVPSYPEGTVGTSLGYVKVTSTGLLFDRKTARCEGFLVSSSIPPPTMFCLSVLPNGSSQLLWASPPDKDTDLVFEANTRIATCYILGEDTHSRSALRDPVARALLGHHDGARFALQKREGNTLYLLYEHPVSFRYSAKAYDAYNRLKEDGSGWALVNAEKIDINDVYHIDSGRYPPLPLNDMCVGLCSSGDLFLLI